MPIYLNEPSNFLKISLVSLRNPAEKSSWIGFNDTKLNECPLDGEFNLRSCTAGVFTENYGMRVKYGYLNNADAADFRGPSRFGLFSPPFSLLRLWGSTTNLDLNFSDTPAKYLTHLFSSKGFFLHYPLFPFITFKVTFYTAELTVWKNMKVPLKVYNNAQKRIKYCVITPRNETHFTA